MKDSTPYVSLVDNLVIIAMVVQRKHKLMHLQERIIIKIVAIVEFLRWRPMAAVRDLGRLFRSQSEQGKQKPQLEELRNNEVVINQETNTEDIIIGEEGKETDVERVDMEKSTQDLDLEGVTNEEKIRQLIW
jgi:hypothetical protein